MATRKKQEPEPTSDKVSSDKLSFDKLSFEKLPFEELLRRLEAIVGQLERGEVSLEDSMKMHEEGMLLSQACAEKLAKAELTLKRLGKDMEGNLALFDEKEEE
jgi:exodeoxyribonuclease VII small subunit